MDAHPAVPGRAALDGRDRCVGGRAPPDCYRLDRYVWPGAGHKPGRGHWRTPRSRRFVRRQLPEGPRPGAGRSAAASPGRSSAGKQGSEEVPPKGPTPREMTVQTLSSTQWTARRLQATVRERSSGPRTLCGPGDDPAGEGRPPPGREVAGPRSRTTRSTSRRSWARWSAARGDQGSAVAYASVRHYRSGCTRTNPNASAIGWKWRRLAVATGSGSG